MWQVIRMTLRMTTVGFEECFVVCDVVYFCLMEEPPSEKPKNIDESGKEEHISELVRLEDLTPEEREVLQEEMERVGLSVIDPPMRDKGYMFEFTPPRELDVDAYEGAMGEVGKWDPTLGDLFMQSGSGEPGDVQKWEAYFRNKPEHKEAMEKLLPTIVTHAIGYIDEMKEFYGEDE